MENNGIFPNSSGGSGILGLEMSLNHQQTTNYHHHQPPYASKQKASPISDEEEHHSNNLNMPATTEDSGGDGKLRKGSPWQRMKWTDNMVRLLIMVVFYVGDEAGSDQPPASDTSVKKKTGSGAGGGGVVQKKGKWKSVSWAMMERGFYVSPQQCEDKFNDLNKRYKRVNDILGKGTACKVVENQSLLESMEHIPVKLKEEVKKLLNSKHLFFREMCAYHNSSAGAGCGGVAAHDQSSLEVYNNNTDHDSTYRQNTCVHAKGNDAEEEEEDDDDNDNDNDHDHDHDDENNELGDEDVDDGVSNNNRKRSRVIEPDGHHESMMNRFTSELSCVIQDLTKSVWEKRQWMKMKMMQLEEEKLGVQGESYELEKRRSKWLKFSFSKEREMEMEKIKNERMKLENERMVLLLRQKEMELVDLQQQYSSNIVHKRTSDPSNSINGY